MKPDSKVRNQARGEWEKRRERERNLAFDEFKYHIRLTILPTTAVRITYHCRNSCIDLVPLDLCIFLREN